MAENTKIEWCDHTFNPWIGCTKISPGCTNCYAATDTFARRERSHGRELWGPHGLRHRTSVDYWKKPLRWNKDVWYQCLDCGWRGSHNNTLSHAYWEREICPTCKGFNTEFTRQRIFCASLADVFEDRPDIFLWRDDLFRLIEQTPNLDWLILTKRPENIKRDLPDNVWIGTSVENQKYADERIPALLKVPAKVRFLSCEPLLGPVDLKLTSPIWESDDAEDWHPRSDYLDWVICGGESGPYARPMHPDWARSLRDQCSSLMPFLFKQWGAWITSENKFDNVNGHMIPGSTGIHWLEDWFPVMVGKHRSGRLLDGKEWSEFPK